MLTYKRQSACTLSIRCILLVFILLSHWLALTLHDAEWSYNGSLHRAHSPKPVALPANWFFQTSCYFVPLTTLPSSHFLYVTTIFIPYPPSNSSPLIALPSLKAKFTISTTLLFFIILRIITTWVQPAEPGQWPLVSELWRPWRIRVSVGGIMLYGQLNNMWKATLDPCLRQESFLLHLLLVWFPVDSEMKRQSSRRSLWGQLCTWVAGVPTEEQAQH